MRTRAISCLRRDHGMSTLALRAFVPFRMRVSMSAIGSVSMARSPARLREPGDLAAAREPSETEPAHPEAPVEGARTPAQRATIVSPHLELRWPRGLHHQTSLRHVRLSLGSERHAERAEERLPLRVGPGRRADDDREALDLVDLVQIDLREDHLLAETERVVAATVEGSVRNALEVAHAGQRHVHQSVEELVHPV